MWHIIWEVWSGKGSSIKFSEMLKFFCPLISIHKDLCMYISINISIHPGILIDLSSWHWPILPKKNSFRLHFVLRVHRHLHFLGKTHLILQLHPVCFSVVRPSVIWSMFFLLFSRVCPPLPRFPKLRGHLIIPRNRMSVLQGHYVHCTPSHAFYLSLPLVLSNVSKTSF